MEFIDLPKSLEKWRWGVDMIEKQVRRARVSDFERRATT
jgi:hypothetical protein